MDLTVVMVAGGSGKRMGADKPKQFLQLEDAPILIHSLRRFINWKPSISIALVLPKAHFPTYHALAEAHLSVEEREKISLCEGGDSRTASVWAGIQYLYGQSKFPMKTLVGIHDGVRPFIRMETLDQAYSMAEKEGASVVCVPAKASLRRRLSDGSSEAVDRSLYFHVQTPQVFRLDKIYQAFLERPHDAFTDDASLYQHMGGKVAICEGSYDNLKITTPEDLSVGKEILLRQRQDGL